MASLNISNNLLLYGPPGTGKTYNVVNYAVAIVENRPLEEVIAEGYSLALEKYDRYTKMGRVAFMTFHQSLSYDDFIEGIRPVVDDRGNLLYVATPGVFYSFCQSAENPKLLPGENPLADLDVKSDAALWAVAPGGFGDTPEKERAFSESNIPFECLPEGAKIGDVLFSMAAPDETDGVGIITEDPAERKDEAHVSVDWVGVGVRFIADKKQFAELPCKIRGTKVKSYIESLPATDASDAGNCVFIIDEINRGNISRIFGELITLLESSRRKGMPECLEAYLAQLKVMFSVPQNVYLVGTMNTADKSLTALDTALRRRFEFVEMMPDPDVLKGRKVADVELSKLLAVMNERIEVLYDREHTIGHAYFIGVKTIDDLAQCFIKKVIPLLQEYFFDDYEKICWVLGHADNPRKCDFIRVKKRSEFQMKFNLPDIYEIETNYRVYVNPESYIQIYRGSYL
ncbi:MAG: AAA domain-containing protein [Thermoplasmatales archaeon]|nr:AAA domain-containing protein [Thermoplasmatales archaeon]